MVSNNEKTLWPHMLRTFNSRDIDGNENVISNINSPYWGYFVMSPTYSTCAVSLSYSGTALEGAGLNYERKRTINRVFFTFSVKARTFSFYDVGF